MGEQKRDYNKLLTDIRNILNKVDPEGLMPGETFGAPYEEYDDEAIKIVSYIIHHQEDIKINKNTLICEINKIWNDNFNNDCKKVDLVAQELFRIIY